MQQEKASKRISCSEKINCIDCDCDLTDRIDFEPFVILGSQPLRNFSQRNVTISYDDVEISCDDTPDVNEIPRLCEHVLICYACLEICDAINSVEFYGETIECIQ